MKACVRTQRRGPQQTGPGVSLFPFLAVLVCTMGALVPLLLVITRTARMQAEAAALAKAAKQGDEVRIQREDAQWRIEQLKKSRAKAHGRLADARLELGHLEDHSRRLRGQLGQYQAAIADLEKSANGDQKRLAQSQAELERIRAQIGAARQQLVDVHQTATDRSRCYAVVPYEGPNQTHRRPIYLECREDAVVLQPEGIELTETDFEGPLGPGNPLAAALRAAREYMLARREFDPQAGEPYPLLLAPPEGINAYYAARAAMKSWGFEFGYELIDDGWKLAYPPPDPRLAEQLRQVVASARVHQARLAAAAPRQYARQPKVVYRASSRGGFIREGGSADDDQGYRSSSPSGPVGRAEGSSGNGGKSGTGGKGASDNPYEVLAQGSGTPTTGDGPAGRNSGAGVPGATESGPALGTPAAGVSASVGTSGTAGSNASATENSSPAVPGATGSGTSSSSSSGANVAGVSASSADPRSSTASIGSAVQKVERPDGYVVGQPPREQPEQSASSESLPSSGQKTVRLLRPGEWEPSPEPPPKKHHDKDDKDDQEKEKEDGKHGRKPPKNLVDMRGADWGLRDVARGSVGVTRPIRVECHADRLVVVSERGPADNKVIPLGPRAESSADTFISAIWEHMEVWGMAGRGMYWRPLLQVHVAPGAESRFAELSALLEGSGLMVERK